MFRAPHLKGEKTISDLGTVLEITTHLSRGLCVIDDSVRPEVFHGPGARYQTNLLY